MSVLRAIDSENSHTPFPYDVHALGHLRSDQVPRFLGSLTHPEDLKVKTLPLSDLVAIQDRVNTKKVEAIREAGVTECPVVVRMNDRNYLIDGHHRATAEYLNGKNKIKCRYNDLTKIDNSVKARHA